MTWGFLVQRLLQAAGKLGIQTRKDSTWFVLQQGSWRYRDSWRCSGCEARSGPNGPMLQLYGLCCSWIQTLCLNSKVPLQYMYVCMYVCMYLNMYTYPIYINIYAYICISIPVYIYIYVYLIFDPWKPDEEISPLLRTGRPNRGASAICMAVRSASVADVRKKSRLSQSKRVQTQCHYGVGAEQPVIWYGFEGLTAWWRYF